MLTSRREVDKFACRTIVSDAAPIRIVPRRPRIMNLRLTVSLVFVASLAYACGPRARADASLSLPVASTQGFALASMTGTTRIVETTNAREKTLKRESSKLATSFDVGQ